CACARAWAKSPDPLGTGVRSAYANGSARRESARARSGCGAGDGVGIAALLEFKGKFGSAGAHDPSFGEDVDAIRFHIIQQALVMGDDEHAAIRTAQRVDALRDLAQGVDIETGIRLV